MLVSVSPVDLGEEQQIVISGVRRKRISLKCFKLMIDFRSSLIHPILIRLPNLSIRETKSELILWLLIPIIHNRIYENLFLNT